MTRMKLEESMARGGGGLAALPSVAFFVYTPSILISRGGGGGGVIIPYMALWGRARTCHVKLSEIEEARSWLTAPNTRSPDKARDLGWFVPAPRGIVITCPCVVVQSPPGA
uniref:Uncharacterized protein n=1 Tax=Knipowitschia caucasica TaxID=637954 RepID=A0AAV2KWV2_KNICA